MLVLGNTQVGIGRTNLSMCNPMSNYLQCAAFLNQVPSTYQGNWVKAHMVIQQGANALYQANDKCTMADLTSVYWSITSDAKAVTSFTIMFLILSFLGF